MNNYKHIPLIYIQCASIEHHLIKHGYNEARIKNYMNLGLSINQSVLDEWEL